MKKVFCMFIVLFISIFLLIGTGWAPVLPTSKTLEAATGKGELFLQLLTQGCGYEPNDFATKTEASFGDDPDYTYEWGLVEFVINCIIGDPVSPASKKLTNGVLSAEMQITYFPYEKNIKREVLPAGLEGTIYRKFGPTPGNPTPHWYDFMFDGQTGAVIQGNTITLYFVDGMRGDDDLQANGIIVDQGGPARLSADVPAITTWGMMIFLILAGLGAIYYLRRKRIEN